jgi:hypothetical protein
MEYRYIRMSIVVYVHESYGAANTVNYQINNTQMVGAYISDSDFNYFCVDKAYELSEEDKEKVSKAVEDTERLDNSLLDLVARSVEHYLERDIELFAMDGIVGEINNQRKIEGYDIDEWTISEENYLEYDNVDNYESIVLYGGDDSISAWGQDKYGLEHFICSTSTEDQLFHCSPEYKNEDIREEVTLEYYELLFFALNIARGPGILYEMPPFISNSNLDDGEKRSLRSMIMPIQLSMDNDKGILKGEIEPLVKKSHSEWVNSRVSKDL